MRLLFISLNYAPEPTATGMYTGELCEALAAMGHDVHVICANPYYPEWKLAPGYRNIGWRSELLNGVTVHRCMCWIPSKVNGATRLAHYASFSLTMLLPLVGRIMRKPPDRMFLIAPTLMPAVFAAPLARLRGIPTWIHVQDFEVEAGFATGQMNKSSLLGRLAGRFEQLMFAGFMRASSISPEMCKKLIQKGFSEHAVYELRNWANVDRIVPQEASSYRNEWGIHTPHVALYSGSIAKKQGIDLLFDVARHLESRGDTTLIICGNGPDRSHLEEAARNIPNILFRDLQPAERLGDLLALATVHLLPQKAEAADLVLPSKLCNMLASGRPVVAGAHAGTGLAREVEGVGINVAPENAAAMSEAIEFLLDHPEERRRLGKCARQRAEERWSKAAIIERFEREIALDSIQKAAG
ncbi:WcaI family glycosyltransferase [Sphingopyxis indica]|uniref:Colanic acid biosynthesis glycosyl transferase WcaI n=1 Tax=Sphingopyxis indica TaxID=436663 RepID=A0A239D6B1_9SPHN|nr:WcaI family glycosyltransferase [Sphingopyxis indica]SNS27827.1 colanic acid biosynthesis glycosyl transferase WcaI [Sphingopyxis indica]